MQDFVHQPEQSVKPGSLEAALSAPAPQQSVFPSEPKRQVAKMLVQGLFLGELQDTRV